MREATPALELAAAEPRAGGILPPVALDLRLMPGECALIEMRDPVAIAEFADLCVGLRPLGRGRVCFLGRAWSGLTARVATALRGRIGRIAAAGAWIDFLGTDTNVLLPHLHHTKREEPILRAAAATLAREFGLPGLPLVRPDALSAADLARTACVRAFLGEPRLLLLETPVQTQFLDLIAPLLNAIAAARDRGAAVIWLTRRYSARADRSFPATHRLRMTERGLQPVRQGA